MALTMRQTAFLSKLLDLYAEAREPLHYSRVAETLGVSPATAYDMLRVLQRKGMVRAEYSLADRPTGPGRANVVFSPTSQAHELFAQLVGQTDRDEEWEETKARLLAAVRRSTAEEHCHLLDDILAHAPKTVSPLAYAAEIITALLLTIREEKYRFGPRSPLSTMLENTAGRFGMSMLAGLAFGLSAAQKSGDRQWIDLAGHVRRFETAYQELSAERSQDLRDFVREVVTTLQTQTS